MITSKELLRTAHAARTEGHEVIMLKTGVAQELGQLLEILEQVNWNPLALPPKATLECGLPIMLALGVLLQRHGVQDISQADIDNAAYGRVLEGHNNITGALSLIYEPRTQQ